jgi:gamma-glutamyltranspeptidase/glutathione hydrolase
MRRINPQRFAQTVLFAAIIVLPVPGAGEPASRLPVAGVASAHPEATRAGEEILLAGGNAFDAAVAIAAVLAVVEPYSSGLGGGGFWLLHCENRSCEHGITSQNRAARRVNSACRKTQSGFDVVIDARERAPFAADRNMYLDSEGNPRPRASLDGPLAAGIPGTPAALAHIADCYGRLPLHLSLGPAIRLARHGFAVTARYREMATRRRETLMQFPEAAGIFLHNGLVPDVGAIVRQPDLGVTLTNIAEQGHAGFYGGAIGRKLVAGIRSAGGIWQARDLTEYAVVERAPVHGTYGQVRITSAGLPSSGGIVLIEMLNILNGFDLEKFSRAERAHVIIEAMRFAYRDRADFLGDPDFAHVDTRRLIDPQYADTLRERIGTSANRSEALPWASRPIPAADQTTHFSVIDRDGNRAAVTLSINGPFGSGFVVPSTGVLLNNEMDDFAVKPHVPNTYGLVGADANAIAPGKRPLSSMTPTFLESDDAVLVLGTPGGSRIITMVLLAALEFSARRGDPRDWVALPRFHHQFLPDRVEYEIGTFTESEIEELTRRGHTLMARSRRFGNMQVVWWDKKNHRIEAASDPRGEGVASVR